MRTIAVLSIAATFVAHATVAGAQLNELIPEPLRGVWVPSTGMCRNASGSTVVVSAQTYSSSEAICRVVWVDETPAVPGSLYFAHLRCSKPKNGAEETLSDVLLLPKNINQIVIGTDFSDLKDYQRCPASESATPR
jgi:hypothetical protein